MKDLYTGSLSEKLDWSEEAIKERTATRDEWDQKMETLKIEGEKNYRVVLPGICKQWLEEEIEVMEHTKLSMLTDEKEKTWKKDLMLNIVKDFIATDCSIFSSMGKTTEWLKNEYEIKRQQIRDIAYENN